MLDFEEEWSETDVHFDRAMLERLHRRDAPQAREDRAWLLAPDEDARPLPPARPGHDATPDAWRAYHTAIRRLGAP